MTKDNSKDREPFIPADEQEQHYISVCNHYFQRDTNLVAKRPVTYMGVTNKPCPCCSANDSVGIGQYEDTGAVLFYCFTCTAIGTDFNNIVGADEE